jgi:hypothetical protein
VPLGFEGLNSLSDDHSPGVYAPGYRSSYKRNFVMQIASRELPEFVSLLRLPQERIHHECGGMPMLYCCVSSSCSDSSSGSCNRRSVNRRKCTEGGVMFVLSLSRSPSSFPSPPVPCCLRHILAFPTLSSHLLCFGCGLAISIDAMSSLLRMPTVLTKF